MTPVRRAVTLLALAALAAGGCGDGEAPAPAPSGADPATLAPPDAAVYAGAVVRPEGDQQEAVDSALGRLLNTDDPGDYIVDRINEELSSQSADLSFEEDIQPWLGSRAGVFFEARGLTGDPAGAVIVQVTDPGAAQSAIDELAAADKQPEQSRSYGGVDYEVDSDGDAAGLVADFLVAGSESGLRGAIEASKGGSLADVAEYRDEAEAVPDDNLALVYVDPATIVAELERTGEASPGGIATVQAQLGDLLRAPIAASLSVTSSQFTLGLSAAAPEGQFASGASSVLGDLPSDAWLVVAAGGAGETAATVLESLSTPLAALVGFDLPAELQAWLGDAAGFLSGTNPLALGGAVVLETRDEAASEQTIEKLQQAVERIPAVQVEPVPSGAVGFQAVPFDPPIPFTVQQDGDRVVAGLSHSVEEILNGESSIEDSDAFNAATEGLGDLPAALYLDFQDLVQFLSTIPDTAGDPGFAAARPYLEALDYLAIGAETDGDRFRLRVVLGLLG